jgi:hypothetical protein
MPALPADIARFTNDGIVVQSPAKAASDALKAQHVDARGSADTEIEMFFDSSTGAQAMLDERFSYLGKVAPTHVGIEVQDTLGLGEQIPITPNVPSFLIVDGDSATIARVRAYAYDMGTDRFSVEVLA